MAKKTGPFNQQGLNKLPNDRPVVYKILTDGGKNNYTGIAQRGRVQDRLAEHLAGGKDPVPGAKVVIQQHSSIDDARATEQKVIARSQPK